MQLTLKIKKLGSNICPIVIIIKDTNVLVTHVLDKVFEIDKRESFSIFVSGQIKQHSSLASTNILVIDRRCITSINSLILGTTHLEKL